MKYGVYTICDNVAGISGPVFQAVNDGVARREFARTIGSSGVFCPDDYVLYKVGEWDDVTREMTSLKDSVLIRDTDLDVQMYYLQMTEHHRKEAERRKEVDNE